MYAMVVDGFKSSDFLPLSGFGWNESCDSGVRVKILNYSLQFGFWNRCHRLFDYISDCCW